MYRERGGRVDAGGARAQSGCARSWPGDRGRTAKFGRWTSV